MGLVDPADNWLVLDLLSYCKPYFYDFVEIAFTCDEAAMG